MRTDTPMSRAAVVVNPTKLDDDEAFRKSVRQIMDDHGWDEPLWLETTPEDPAALSAQHGFLATNIRQGVDPAGQRLVRAGAGSRSGSKFQGQKRSGVFLKLVIRVWA